MRRSIPTCRALPGLYHNTLSVHHHLIELEMIPSSSATTDVEKEAEFRKIKAMWQVPHPDCARSIGAASCDSTPYEGENPASYAVDFLPGHLPTRNVRYEPDSGSLSFNFYVVADGLPEPNERLKIILLPQSFSLGDGFEQNNEICIGVCGDDNRLTFDTPDSDAIARGQIMIVEIVDHPNDSDPSHAHANQGCYPCSVVRIVEGQAAPDGGGRVPEREPVPLPQLGAPPNQPPTVTRQLSGVTLETQRQQDVSLAGVFNDPDHDPLVISAVSSDTSIVRLGMWADRSALTLGAVREGTASITVTASDSRGGVASTVFRVTVKGRPPAPAPAPSPTPTPTPAPTPNPAPEDVVERYDENDDGEIDVTEYRRAVKDYTAGKIDYTEMLEIIHAMFGFDNG